MISFKNFDNIIDELVVGLLHPSVPTSWNVVLPPIYDETTFVSAIIQKLRESRQSPIVALLSSDSIKAPLEFVQKLHQQWNETTCIPGPIRGASADTSLKRLLDSVPHDRPAVQILTRFHKILDRLDQWVLSSVRAAEQSRALRTLTIAPFDYDELKRRWERRGKLMIASNYGDMHSIKKVELMSEEDIDLANKSQSEPIPPHIMKFALVHTGGYPVPFQGVVDEWIRLNRPELKPEVKARLRATAEQRMSPLVRHLDVAGESRYRDAIVDLFLGKKADDSGTLQMLSRHPWSNFLLNGNGLRAEAFGNAVVDAAVKDEIKCLPGTSHVAGIMLKAIDMYSCKQYATAIKLVDTHTEEKSRAPILQLLRAHARVMATIYGNDEEVEPGVDTDWNELRRNIADARKVLARMRDRVRNSDTLEGRYNEMDHVAGSILNATKGGQSRVVDILAGCMDSQSQVDPRTALMLLILRLEASQAIRGNASSCHSIMALPEQIFRVWAMWNLKLNYYKAPDGNEEIWTEVEKKWPHGDLRRPSPGGEFTSFEVFAYYALAMALHKSVPPSALPEADFRSLTQALSALSIRRDSAHALAITTKKTRDQLFKLAGRWFDQLLPKCEAHDEPFSRDELLAPMEPLPIVGEDHSPIWF